MERVIEETGAFDGVVGFSRKRLPTNMLFPELAFNRPYESRLIHIQREHDGIASRGEESGLFKFAVLICRYLIFLKQRSFFCFQHSFTMPQTSS